MTERRLCCEVLGCKRTKLFDATNTVEIEGTAVPLDVWICQTHWTAVDPGLRRLYAAARRRLKKDRSVRSANLWRWIFRRARRQAIERAMGV